jgi:hypothetical protein
VSFKLRVVNGSIIRQTVCYFYNLAVAKKKDYLFFLVNKDNIFLIKQERLENVGNFRKKRKKRREFMLVI